MNLVGRSPSNCETLIDNEVAIRTSSCVAAAVVDLMDLEILNNINMFHTGYTLLKDGMK